MNLKEILFFLGILIIMVSVAVGGSYYFDSKLPQCSDFDKKKVGTTLIPHDMGPVNVEGEDCHVIEITERVCYTGQYSECKGDYLFCDNKVISRLTKCPSGTVTNSVTRTGGKFSHEEVQ